MAWYQFERFWQLAPSTLEHSLQDQIMVPHEELETQVYSCNERIPGSMDFHFSIKTNPTFLPLPKEIDIPSIVENQFNFSPFQQE